MPEDPASSAAAKPVEAFASVVALRKLAVSLEHAAVDQALADGWTWAQIGQALGMTAQAAHKRLARLLAAETSTGGDDDAAETRS